jgi:ABC-type branched-subunit amino acid transport system ATPase component
VSLLETRELTKRFGGLTAIDGLTLTVEAGEVRGLIGPNGSGKSTVINIVTGVLRPSAGSVRFRGEEITGQATEALFHRGMARTFQTPRVVPGLTALENVLVARARLVPLELFRSLGGGRGRRRAEDVRRRAAHELLDVVGLQAHAETPAETLPHARRRLLEIARALAGDPALLFLDEPAAGMSETETAAVMTLVRALAERGVAIVLVEHNMRVVMTVADRVTVLDFGRVIAEGRPAEIGADRAVREAYLGLADERAKPLDA